MSTLSIKITHCLHYVYNFIVDIYNHIGYSDDGRDVNTMGVSDKIKGMVTSSGLKINDLAEYFGKGPQVMRNKLYKGSFSAEDLTKIATFLGGVHTITLPNGQVTTFVENDFEKAE